MPMESLLEETSTPIDPKRIFSALMKEIDTAKVHNSDLGPANTSPGAESDVFESSATKELHAISSRELHSSTSRECRSSISSEQRPTSRCRPNTAQSKTSSIRSLGRALKSTIRTVTPLEYKSSPPLEQQRVHDASRQGHAASSDSASSRNCTVTTSVMRDSDIQM